MATDFSNLFPGDKPEDATMRELAKLLSWVDNESDSDLDHYIVNEDQMNNIVKLTEFWMDYAKEYPGTRILKPKPIPALGVAYVKVEVVDFDIDGDRIARLAELTRCCSVWGVSAVMRKIPEAEKIFPEDEDMQMRLIVDFTIPNVYIWCGGSNDDSSTNK